jgi:hypothetical protein
LRSWPASHCCPVRCWCRDRSPLPRLRERGASDLGREDPCGGAWAELPQTRCPLCLLRNGGNRTAWR